MKRSRELEKELDPDAESTGTQDSETHSHQALKVTQLDSAIADDCDDDDNAIIMRCSLPPHKDPLTFRTYDEYEVHYNKTHTNRCLECHKNFPTQHLLDVHIEEFHDPLVLVRREKGEHTYTCFVEGCERKCMTHQKRRMHLIDKHMYPKNFFFAVTKEGIDGRRSLLNESSHHRRRSSTNTQSKETRRRASLLESTTSQSEDKPSAQASQEKRKEDRGDDPADTDMAELTGAMSSLHFIPPSIKFGKGRAGFAKR